MPESVVVCLEQPDLEISYVAQTVAVEDRVVEIVEVAQQGLQGPAGTAAGMVINELPAGLINGVNATFTTSQNFDPDTVQVFLNGLSQIKPDEYNTSGNNTIIMATSPETGAILRVNYALP